MKHWLAAIVFFFASIGEAQTCTVECTGVAACDTISEFDGLIDGASDGQTVCLRSGVTLTGNPGISLSTSHSSSNRVKVCTSDAGGSGSCDTTETTWGRITNNAGGGCINFNATDGYTVEHLDCYATGANSSSAIQFASGAADSGASYITLDGVLVDGYGECVSYGFGEFEAELPHHLSVGTCSRNGDGTWTEANGPGHWLECRNGAKSGDRKSSYGALKTSTISVYVHSFAQGVGAPNTSHYDDIGNGFGTECGASCVWSNNQHDITFECGKYRVNQTDGISYPGTSLLKINRGYNLILRDWVFESINGGTSLVSVALADHASFGSEGIASFPTDDVAGGGMQIYRVTFNRISGVWNSIGADVDMFNNLGIFVASDDGRGLYQTSYTCCAADDVTISNIRLFNNTVYVTGVNAPSTGYPLLHGNAGGSATHTPLCNNCQVFNNAVHNVDTENANTIDYKSSCGEFGANAVNVHHNFIYAPNAGPGVIWPGCTAAHDNSGQTGDLPANYTTVPGFVNPGTDFDITSGSAVYQKAIDGGAPSTDFDILARPSPASLGAYDVAPAGGGGGIQGSGAFSISEAAP